MNVFASFLALLIIIFYVLRRKGKLKSKTFKIILASFAILIMFYGMYQLFIGDVLRKAYPGKYYTTGGLIAISIAIMILIPILLGIKKDRTLRRITSDSERQKGQKGTSYIDPVKREK